MLHFTSHINRIVSPIRLGIRQTVGAAVAAVSLDVAAVVVAVVVEAVVVEAVVVEAVVVVAVVGSVQTVLLVKAVFVFLLETSSVKRTFLTTEMNVTFLASLSTFCVASRSMKALQAQPSVLGMILK